MNHMCWFGAFFDDDDFFAYTLKWWIVLGKSQCNPYDWCELDELYALGKVCALCKMDKVACTLILLKW